MHPSSLIFHTGLKITLISPAISRKTNLSVACQTFREIQSGQKKKKKFIDGTKRAVDFLPTSS